jgi:hypothetical protein
MLVVLSRTFDGTGDVPVLMQGFPPPPEQRVTPENWQLAPYNRWSFHHVREVVPTARVARGAGLPHVPPEGREDVAALPVTPDCERRLVR